MPKPAKPYRASVVDRLRDDPGLQREYLKAAMEENRDVPEALLAALRSVAEAKGFARLAAQAGMSSKSLYKVLDMERGGQPRFETICKIVDALGLRLTIEPKSRVRSKAALQNSLLSR